MIRPYFYIVLFLFFTVHAFQDGFRGGDRILQINFYFDRYLFRWFVASCLAASGLLVLDRIFRAEDFFQWYASSTVMLEPAGCLVAKRTFQAVLLSFCKFWGRNQFYRAGWSGVFLMLVLVVSYDRAGKRGSGVPVSRGFYCRK